MNGFLLLAPFLAVRFGLLAILNKSAVRRASYFAPVQGREKIAYVTYQAANTGLFVYLFFLRIQMDFSPQFYIGAVLYLLGLGLCAVCMVHFSAPDGRGMNTDGLYRFSRNPMYIAYFICFAGMALLTRSAIFFGILLIFQISAHWIILAEERWCIERFGEAYRQYMKRVRRYI